MNEHFLERCKIREFSRIQSAVVQMRPINASSPRATLDVVTKLQQNVFRTSITPTPEAPKSSILFSREQILTGQILQLGNNFRDAPVGHVHFVVTRVRHRKRQF
jgi:hypothetical protein